MRQGTHTIKFLVCLGVTLLLCWSTGVVFGEEDDEIAVEEVVAEPETPIDIPYKTPIAIGNVYIAEHFDDRADFQKKWIISETKKEGAEEKIAKYNGEWELEAPEKNPLKGDLGLVLKSKARHHAISARLDKPFTFDSKPFILQYEVRFQSGQECGGAYLKLLSQTPNLDLRSFHDKTPYTMMFGPDKCGNDNKLHWIFRHRNPKNGTFEEKHWKKTGNIPKFDDVFKDKKPHLFTLALQPDNQFEVFVDKKSVFKGNLLDDFNPPVNPPAEIDDPNDRKPSDWDEREKIPDPLASKPEDWDELAPRQISDPNSRKPENWLDDEPELVSDPHADKPQDWDDEMDGEWEAPLISNPKCEKVGCGEWKAPMIDNPAYKGKWKAPLVDNPNYKGKWKPKRIVNPDFYEDKHPFRMTAIAAVGFELWSMSDSILFDNIIITDDIAVADQWASETWALKKELADKETDNYLVQMIKYTNKYPWLWAVYLVAVGLPVVLFISFCCVTTPSKKEKDAAKQKKTDSPVPDDPPPPMFRTMPSTASKEETVGKSKAPSSTTASPGLADIAEKTKERDEEEDEEEQDEEKAEEEAGTDDEEVEEEEDEEEEESEQAKVDKDDGDAPRRRRPRRE